MPLDHEITIMHNSSQRPRPSSRKAGSTFPSKVMLSAFLFGALLLPVEAFDWRKSGAWGASLLPRAIRSLGGATSSGENLHKRAVNKTLWISAKVYEGDTFFEFVQCLTVVAVTNNLAVNGSSTAGRTIPSMYILMSPQSLLI